MSRFWRLLVIWAKAVLTPTRFESKKAVAVLGSWIVDRDFGDRDSVVLGIVQFSCSWIFIGANGIFTNWVVKYVYI